MEPMGTHQLRAPRYNHDCIRRCCIRRLMRMPCCVSVCFLHGRAPPQRTHTISCAPRAPLYVHCVLCGHERGVTRTTAGHIHCSPSGTHISSTARRTLGPYISGILVVLLALSDCVNECNHTTITTQWITTHMIRSATGPEPSERSIFQDYRL